MRNASRSSGRGRSALPRRGLAALAKRPPDPKSVTVGTISVACALVHRADVFLFDEPLIGIDPAGVHEVKQELMRSRSEGAAILISTHLLDTAEKLCDRVVILAKGRKLAEGTLQQLQQRVGQEGKSLEDVFLTLTEDPHEGAALPNA